MIDHIYLPVTDLKRSDTFYAGMLGPLGKSERWHFKAQAGYPDLTGFGEPGIPGFWLKASKTTCAELYVAFAAKNEAAVRGPRRRLSSTVVSIGSVEFLENVAEQALSTLRTARPPTR